jgi:aryl-alcohol dehydrogenase-like predicted oxidoreductase
MGAALRELKVPRVNYVISTKFYWGIDRGPNPVNRHNTLNRKYLLQAIDGSLQRLGLDFVDLVYCHRPDANTPIEETVWAMSDIIAQGKALYWGTSEWPADAIAAACEVAERHHLRKPVVEQPEYHLFHRRRVEQEYAPLYDTVGLGLTTWSPLASGLLTGKYANGIPSDSRGAMPTLAFLKNALTDPAKNAAVVQLGHLAAELGISSAQLAIAWVLKNPRVSSVITGASRLEQLQHNLAASAATEQLGAEVMKRIDALCGPLAD